MNTTSIPLLPYLCIILLPLLGLIGCDAEEDFLFTSLPTSRTGISFSNDILESDTFNILNFHYIYNGGGVGIGDFDKNGLPDIVFAGNQVSSELYLNKGNLGFQRLNKEGGFSSSAWVTGVSIVDINGDGWADIYLSVGGKNCEDNCHNLLFINQGLDANDSPHFVEMAEAYKLEDGRYTQQAAFFDYDRDGDLDVYLLHNLTDKRDRNAPSEKKFIGEKSKDQLLRNNGNGQFEDVSEEAGIVFRGYGLGLALADINKDQLPDIYVANDFLSDDLLYLNLGNEEGKHKGFKEVSKTVLKHTSYNAMGVDIADVNQDALPDIFVLDMLPEYNERQKTMLGFMNYNKYQLTLRQGYSPQFIRNTLQLHNGFLQKELLPFSEVGYIAGLYNTDWSWSPLLADFDNDGDRDLFVSNGYGKDITDLDFMAYSQTRNPFGSKSTQTQELYEVIKQMESIKMPNYLFENQGGLSFENQQGKWIKKQNSISNGAAYADLDMDGDLDLIVNNINEPAYILENQSTQRFSHNYLKLKLIGEKVNPTALGTHITLWTQGNKQTHYHAPVRGYLSSMEDIIHLGLGQNSQVDSLRLIWPNGKSSFHKNISANQTLELDLAASVSSESKLSQLSSTLFSSDSTRISYQHIENPYQDFDAQHLLLHQHSRQGPCLTQANVNGIAGDEVFIGGAKGEASQLFTQDASGNYSAQLLENSFGEDTDAAFFDLDQDGDQDLYVVKGGVEFKDGAEEYRDLLYINNGRGNFSLSKEIISPANTSGSCVRPFDFDKDGDIDLFVGTRLNPRKYPSSSQSYLLLNENGTLKSSPKNNPFIDLGRVSDAIWSDYDGDGWEDLIVIGEWMPIRIFKNIQGTFDQKNVLTLDHSTGLWSSIAGADFDKDGDIDFLVGNLGQNSRLKASPQEPLFLYSQDFDQNGSPDPLIGQYYLDKQGERRVYPIHTRDDIFMQLAKIKSRYVKYVDFSTVSFSDLFQEELSSLDFLKIEILASVFMKNEGEGKFTLTALPQEAQLAPIQDMLIDDFNGDGLLDALLSGNDYGSEKNNGRYDAFNGLLILGNGGGGFRAVPTSKSGFYVPEDGRDIIQVVDNQGKRSVWVGQNSSNLCLFSY